MGTVSGRPDYDAGDLVVCVDIGVIRCNGGQEHRAFARNIVRKGRVYRVEAITPDVNGVVPPCGCLNVKLEGGLIGHPARFRKIDPKPPEFFAGKIETKAPQKENA